MVGTYTAAKARIPTTRTLVRKLMFRCLTMKNGRVPSIQSVQAFMAFNVYVMLFCGTTGIHISFDGMISQNEFTRSSISDRSRYLVKIKDEESMMSRCLDEVL